MVAVSPAGALSRLTRDTRGWRHCEGGSSGAWCLPMVHLVSCLHFLLLLLLREPLLGVHQLRTQDDISLFLVLLVELLIEMQYNTILDEQYVGVGCGAICSISPAPAQADNDCVSPLPNIISPSHQTGDQSTAQFWETLGSDRTWN